MPAAVEATGLTKRYGDVTAVDAVDFALAPDRIHGLLGRNGAGKTTIMQLITAQILPSSGRVTVFGEQPYENRRVLERICFIKEGQKYPDHFRVADVLDACAWFFTNWDRDYARRLVEAFKLPLRRSTKKLSRGMLSALGIVVGLASRAPLTIFDEPYLGLDAVARDLFYAQLLEDYAAHPRTILLSSHLIDEVSGILEHVVVVDGGKVLLDEDADALRGRAFTVVGPAAAVNHFTAGTRVIERRTLGASASACVLGRLDEAGRRRAGELGLALAPVSMQQLIVQLTKDRTQSEKEAAVR